MRSRPLTEFVKPGCEAFAILCVENTLESCVALAKEPLAEFGRDGRKVSRKDWNTKWTSGKSGDKCCGGWSEKGLERFNQLRKLVVANRKAESNFDDLFLSIQRKMEEDDKGGDVGNFAEEEEEVIEVDCDFD